MNNFIPNISTTDAIVAGIQVSQAIKYIINHNKYNTTTSTSDIVPVTNDGTKFSSIDAQFSFPPVGYLEKPVDHAIGSFLMTCYASGPSPICYVCGRKPTIVLLVSI